MLIYRSLPFALFATPQKDRVDILMRVNSPTIYTNELPLTLPLLSKFVPSIFKSKCFNYKNQPFKTEVKDTEVGHLFEHILLEFLCMKKLAKGYESSSFSGVTSWNWEKEKKGIFHITIDVSKCDYQILKFAIKKTISLMHLIFDSQTSLKNPVLAPVSIKYGKSMRAGSTKTKKISHH